MPWPTFAQGGIVDCAKLHRAEPLPRRTKRMRHAHVVGATHSATTRSRQQWQPEKGVSRRECSHARLNLPETVGRSRRHGPMETAQVAVSIEPLLQDCKELDMGGWSR
jgi:hypothetical protein